MYVNNFKNRYWHDAKKMYKIGDTGDPTLFIGYFFTEQLFIFILIIKPKI